MNSTRSILELVELFFEDKKYSFDFDRDISVPREFWEGRSSYLEEIALQKLDDLYTNFKVYKYPNTVIIIPSECLYSIVVNLVTGHSKVLRM